MRFYVCRHCGNIVYFMNASGVPTVCCGEKMQELVPGAIDGAPEKHVPAVTVDGGKVRVRVGGVTHPMIDAHFIQWIVLETAKGFQKAGLRPGDAPEAEFVLAPGDKAVAAYEYCSIHGLWKADIN